jgi:hypothetical protein
MQHSLTPGNPAFYLHSVHTGRSETTATISLNYITSLPLSRKEGEAFCDVAPCSPAEVSDVSEERTAIISRLQD